VINLLTKITIQRSHYDRLASIGKLLGVFYHVRELKREFSTILNSKAHKLPLIDPDHVVRSHLIVDGPDLVGTQRRHAVHIMGTHVFIIVALVLG
jgi:hypothetical protein